MFRSMRRTRLALDERECREILERGEYGVLAVQGDGGYPYAIPLNYVFVDGAIYFHSAKEGHKIDAIAREAKASFCVVDESAVVPERFATAYKSVIAFGRIRIVVEQEERNRALNALVEALSPHVAQESKRAEIDSCRLNDSVAVLAFEPELITGKRGSCTLAG